MEMKKILSFFSANDRFAAHNRMRLLSVDLGKAVAEMDVTEHHLNSVGVLHGGAMFTLADFAFAAACNAQGMVSLAVNASMNFVRAVRQGTVRAVCQQMTEGKIATYQATLYDDEEQVVAVFTGLAYRKNEKLPIPD